MSKWYRILLLAWLGIALALFGEDGELKDLSEISKGRPTMVQGNANSKLTVPFKAYRLKNSHVLWVNWDLLRELDIEFPKEGLTPEFEEKILSEYAYSVPRDSDNLDRDFTNESITFWADRYGGDGVSYNLGSARTGGRKKLQTKGIGQTPLLRDEAQWEDPEFVLRFLERPNGKNSLFTLPDNWVESLWGDKDYLFKAIKKPDHSNGGASIREGVTEGIWGDLLDEEMPYGSNRIAFVLSTGTSTEFGMGVSTPRALIVRENSLRPAHFMHNENAIEVNKKEENVRVRAIRDALKVSLPKPGQGVEDNFGNRIRELVGRISKVFGTQYAKSIYHGSTSPSNIEIDGKAIDHGPLTAVDGFSRFKHTDSGPNGTLLPFYELIGEIVDDFRKTSPKREREQIPSEKETRRLISQNYWGAVHRNMLWLMGVPDEWLDEMIESKAGLEFARSLLKVAKDGNTEVINVKEGQVKTGTGTYSVPKVIEALLAPDMPAKLFKLMPKDETLRKQLTQRWTKLQEQLLKKAASEQITPASLMEYQKNATAVRNKRLTHLYRAVPNWAKVYLSEAAFRLTANRGYVQSNIDNSIAQGRRTYPLNRPYQIVISENYNPLQGTMVRKVFDLKKGEELTLIGAKVYEGNVDVLGQRRKWDEMDGNTVKVTDGKKVHEAKWQREGNLAFVEFPKLTNLNKATFEWSDGSVILTRGNVIYRPPSFINSVVENCQAALTATGTAISQTTTSAVHAIKGAVGQN